MRARHVLVLAAVLALATLSGCIRITIPGGGTQSAQAPQSQQTTAPASQPATGGQTAQPSPAPRAQPAPQEKTAPAVPPSTGDTSSLHHPGFDSPERKAICNALRGPVQGEIDQPVLFVVKTMNVMDGWAFTVCKPVQPNGSDIDYSTTQYADAVAGGAFEDQVTALLRNDGDGWRVVTWDLGATDVVWEPWPERYGAPNGVFR